MGGCRGPVGGGGGGSSEWVRGGWWAPGGGRIVGIVFIGLADRGWAGGAVGEGAARSRPMLGGTASHPPVGGEGQISFPHVWLWGALPGQGE